MDISKAYQLTISVVFRTMGRPHRAKRLSVQEAAYFAEALERLEESARLVDQLRHQRPLGPPRRAAQVPPVVPTAVATQSAPVRDPMPSVGG